MSDRSVLIINRGLEQRTSHTGRTRHTIRIDAEPIMINVDTKALGKPVAEALADHFRNRIRSIVDVASPSTLLKRKYARTAFNKGASWAMKRYSGGRTGSLEPDQSDRLFNDSGRMANSIYANASSDGSWRVNVAANRLDEKTAGPGAVARIFQRLVQLVPEFGNIGLAFHPDTIVRRAFERVNEGRIKAGKMGSKTLTPFQAFRALFLDKGDGS